MATLAQILDKLNYVRLVAIFSLALFAVNGFFSIIFYLLDVDLMANTEFDNFSTIELFFFAVFFAPIVESLIYQFGIIESGLWIREKLKASSIHWFIPGLLSAILFGISHTYNWSYVFITLAIGILLAAVYYYTRKRFGSTLALVMCIITHGVNNIGAFIGQILS